jgi:hypothetical protein
MEGIPQDTPQDAMTHKKIFLLTHAEAIGQRVIPRSLWEVITTATGIAMIVQETGRIYACRFNEL